MLNEDDVAPGGPITSLCALLDWLRHEDWLCVRETWADTAGGSGERWVLVECLRYGGETSLALAGWHLGHGYLRQALRTLTTHQEAPADASE